MKNSFQPELDAHSRARFQVQAAPTLKATRTPPFEHIVLTEDWRPAGHTSFASSHAGKQPFEQVMLIESAEFTG
jgi:hypothetical protein